MTGPSPPSPGPRPVAVFRGTVACRRTSNGLTLVGASADSDDESLILTFVTAALPGVPAALTAPSVIAVDPHHYRISSRSDAWDLEATSVHVHRDIGSAFHRAIPPRLAPLRKRLFWRAVLALAGTRAGKRLLLSLRGR